MWQLKKINPKSSVYLKALVWLIQHQLFFFFCCFGAVKISRVWFIIFQQRSCHGQNLHSKWVESVGDLVAIHARLGGAKFSGLVSWFFDCEHLVKIYFCSKWISRYLLLIAVKCWIWARNTFKIWLHVSLIDCNLRRIDWLKNEVLTSFQDLSFVILHSKASEI